MARFSGKKWPRSGSKNHFVPLWLILALAGWAVLLFPAFPGGDDLPLE